MYPTPHTLDTTGQKTDSSIHTSSDCTTANKVKKIKDNIFTCRIVDFAYALLDVINSIHQTFLR